MSAGGFIYEKVTITSNSSDYATCDDWCVFVHLKRCEAFLRATERESVHWLPVHTNETGEDARNVNYDDNNTVEIYIIPFKVNSNYPAYVSYFRNPTTLSEYAIITGAGFSFNSSSSTAAYINPARLNQLCPTNANYYMAFSFAHAMRMKGAFASYNLASASVATNEIPVTPQYGTCQSIANNADSHSYSMICNYTGSSYNNKLYSFGFAVKGDVVISIYSYEGKTPVWSIIGEIFDNDAIGGNSYGVLCCPHNTTTDLLTAFSAQNWIDAWDTHLSVIDANGDKYPSKTIHDSNANYLFNRCMPSFICERPNATIPARLAYGALCCAFHTGTNLSISGIDSDGNLMKGYINTDVLRVIASRLCANAGSIFQSGNFISMSISSATTAGVLGILLGWDASNGAL